MATLYATAVTNEPVKGTAKVTYDFAKHGGAVGTITLPYTVPDNAVVTHGYVDVLTDFTSGGSATIAAGLNTTTDLKAATAVASWTGIVALIPQGAAANAVKTTAARSLTLTVAVAALTAGKANIYLEYYLSE